MTPKKILPELRKLPTFLQTFFEDDGTQKVWLVYRPGANQPENEANIFSPIHDCATLADDSNITELELTGNPLELDFTVDGSPLEVVSEGNLPSWTPEEATYFPLSLSEVRQHINEYLAFFGETTKTMEPIYGICKVSEDDNPENFVILGASISARHHTSYLVTVLSIFVRESFEEMLKYCELQHLKTVNDPCGSLSKVKFTTEERYYLHGSNLKRCVSTQLSKSSGSVELQVTKTGLEGDKFSFRLNLQVIPGHISSPLQLFWQELLFVKSCINCFNEKIDENTIVNKEDFIGLDVVMQETCDLVRIVGPLEMRHFEEQELQNLRHEDVLDQLFKILKGCYTLSDLRDGFMNFFEEVCDHLHCIRISNENQSTVAHILRRMLNGKLGFTADFSKSLFLLIELGLEKLKNDLVAILSNLYPVSVDIIQQKWSTISLAEVPSTRFSHVLQNISNNHFRFVSQKHNFLYNLYITAEFMYLSNKHIEMSNHMNNDLCKSIFNSFVTINENPLTAMEQISEFSTSLMQINKEVYSNLIPASVKITVNSVGDNLDDTTIINFSEDPIIPPSIYDNYEIPPKVDTKYYHVTKLEKLVLNL